MPSLNQRLDADVELKRLAQRRYGTVSGVPAAATALLISWLRHNSAAPVVVLSSEPEAIYTDLGVFLGSRVEFFPGADTPSFDRVPPSEEATRRRIASIAALRTATAAAVVVSPQGLVRPTLSVEALGAAQLTIDRGASIRREQVIERLERSGYRRVVAVSTPGDFAVRGGIVDVFGLDRARPWRAEWFGDEVDALRAFDVETQTSVAALDSVTVLPPRELDMRPERVATALQMVDQLDVEACRVEVQEAWQRDLQQLGTGFYDEGVDLFFPYLTAAAGATLLDHVPGNALLIAVGGRERFLRAARRHVEEIEKLRDQEVERGELPVGAPSGLLNVDVLATLLAERQVIEINRETEAADVTLNWLGMEAFAGRFPAFVDFAKAQHGAGATIVVASRQQQRVVELLDEADVVSTAVDDFDSATALTPSALVVVEAELSGGFVLPDLGVAVVSDHELFGVTKRRGSMLGLARGARRAESTSSRGARKASSGRAAAQTFVLEFAPGDVVVHRDHGIGRFIEMRTVNDDEGGEHEYMTLEYAEGDRLYVPVAHLDRVDRYIGGADSRPTLSRLGTAEWDRTKRRVKERTEEVARELLGLYSRREMAEGHAFAIDGNWQRELETSFPYQETPDQEMVLDEIKRDMEASKPMDRVVCGDVGFGKTELALRAAFKAACEGRQVAVLVPTTVLSQQHFLTFSERLQPFPISVGQLSRFCSEQDVRATLAGLEHGTVDVVIGTHRLLQRDVKFKNLGLVIIDEEQRFGVIQKEKFKELRVGIDVLSLSATPIPRTMHMALAGIRDLSVIQSPPEERQPIKTYVTAREDSLVREVITRELTRNGQVFYVHNRVQSIEKEAEDLRRLVPEARIGVGHGQMDEHMLSAVMQRFLDGELDVLVATTIIESGLDIPNANTIVINDAHRFGLAQLYQLRGRVGRSGSRAYAYLFYPAQKTLSEKADKRLEVIAELQDLGAGFKLAMRDLEIRGAGNLLGEEQHGEIAAVGLELYNRLLGQAVTALQGKPIRESPSLVTVSLPLASFLPPAYVADETLRLRCYQELAACVDERELDQRARGLVDRFGALPGPAEGLIFSLRVRLLAAAAGAGSVEPHRTGVVVQLPLNHGFDLTAVARQHRQWLTASATRLALVDPSGARLQGEAWHDVLLGALRELGRLARTRQRIAAGV